MNKILNYVTYQTFPAQTANSLQTISNIKYLIKYGVSVNLYFPLREKQSTADINSLQDFYKFTESFNSFGIHHHYPHGKIKFLPKLWFHLSHILWSKKLIKTSFKKFLFEFNNLISDIFFCFALWRWKIYLIN